MSRTIAFLKTLWLAWHNYHVYTQRARILAWQDALQGIDSDVFEDDLIEEMLRVPVEQIVSVPLNPFGRYKDLNERLNDAG